MTDERHYENKSVEPAKGSNYEFFLRGFQILAGYNDAPTWLSLPSLPADLPKWDRRFLETWKRQTDVYDLARRKNAEEQLIAIGVSPNRFDEPDVQSILAKLEAGEKAALLLWETQQPDQRPDRPACEGDGVTRFHRHLCQEVMMGAILAFPRYNNTEICEYLTFGRLHDAAAGPTADHVRRMKKAFIQRMSGRNRFTRNGGAGFHLEIHMIEMRFRSLAAVLDQASRHHDYRLLRGVELADRIEAAEGLYSCIDRARRVPALDEYEKQYARLWIDRYSDKVLQDLRSQQQQ